MEHFVLRRVAARAKGTMDRGKAVRAVFLVLAFGWAMNTSLGGPAGTIHYPDLQTLPPSDIGIEYDPTTGQKLLRFSNTIANLGEGPLEVIPTNNAATAMTKTAIGMLPTRFMLAHSSSIRCITTGTLRISPVMNCTTPLLTVPSAARFSPPAKRS